MSVYNNKIQEFAILHDKCIEHDIRVEYLKSL